MKAVEVLMEHGVPEDRIIFINLVCLRALSVGSGRPGLRHGGGADFVARGTEEFLHKVPGAEGGTYGALRACWLAGWPAQS